MVQELQFKQIGYSNQKVALKKNEGGLTHFYIGC
jgi:hypothetical protein